MYNPETGELIFIDEDYTLPERLSLNKEQLKEWCTTIQDCPELDEMIDVLSAINARIVYDLENNIPSYMPSDIENFLGKQPITVLTDEHWQLHQMKLAHEKEEEKLFEQDQKKVITDIKRKDTLVLVEKELGIEGNKKEKPIGFSRLEKDKQNCLF